ncbi:MAG: tRNA(fMet)-specific endonuclease VapC [Chthoniobacter sp.]|jgi:tRNA(fMet)-specific endonuclease VapC|nr:tRNA(fMet)-specific endonuclease VapC [Chthoniobacter sp.]
MLALDTNHFSEFRRGTQAAERLLSRLAASPEDAALTIVSAEEIVRGWLVEIRRHETEHRLIEAYRHFQENLEDFAEWTLLPWTEASSAIFNSLRERRLRIGTQDLRIASIALTYHATLLTRNLKDFREVPGLHVENWLD